jgi:hypothetical protein
MSQTAIGRLLIESLLMLRLWKPLVKSAASSRSVCEKKKAPGRTSRVQLTLLAMQSWTIHIWSCRLECGCSGGQILTTSRLRLRLRHNSREVK